jgi:hypothetical protein
MTPSNFPIAFGIQDYNTWNIVKDETLIYPKIVYSKTLLKKNPDNGKDELTFEE